MKAVVVFLFTLLLVLALGTAAVRLASPAWTTRFFVIAGGSP